MHEVSKTIEIDYGHTLPAHFSFCNQIHGHRAKIVVSVRGFLNHSPGSSEGMVMDFIFLKQIMMDKIHKVLDHGFAIWKEDKKVICTLGTAGMTTLDFIKERNTKILITDMPPTAEVLVKWAYDEVWKGLKEQYPREVENGDYTITSVVWYETPNSYARYPA